MELETFVIGDQDFKTTAFDLVYNHLSIQQIPEFEIMIQRAADNLPAVKC